MRNALYRAHDLLSTTALVPALHGVKLLLPSERPIWQTFHSSLRFRRESADWGEERRRSWILERLRAVARHAYEQTDYYREQFDAVGFDPRAEFDLSDFARLPIL